MPALKIGLPVALHEDGEIRAFLEAKPRIENLLASYGVPADVGVFAFYTAKLITPERRERQLENQAKYRLPIIHAQTPIFGENALDQEGPNLLDTTIDHVAQLCGQSDSKGCSVDTHIGLAVNDTPATLPGPGIYEKNEFLREKEQVLDRICRRFAQLRERCAASDMTMLLETQITAQYSPRHGHEAPAMHYFPFNDLPTMRHVAGSQITLDVAHLASTLAAEEYFRKNNVSTDTLFALYGITSWEEYRARTGTLQSYLSVAQAIHMSNVTGIGVHLETNPVLARRWGDWGTSEGLLRKEELQAVIRHATRQGTPVMIEVDYDIPRIPERKYAEADEFLRHVFST